MKTEIDEWQTHAYQELASIFNELLQFEQPGQLANRLERLTRELRAYFVASEPIAWIDGEEVYQGDDEPSRFPAVNQDDPNKPGTGEQW